MSCSNCDLEEKKVGTEKAERERQRSSTLAHQTVEGCPSGMSRGGEHTLSQPIVPSFILWALTPLSGVIRAYIEAGGTRSK